MQSESDIVQTASVAGERRGANREVQHPASIEVLRDVEEFSSFHDQWNSIAERSSATIFQTHEWLFLWWKHFGTGGNRTLHILIVRNNRTIVGIIPLFLEVHTMFGFQLYKRLRLLGCGVSDTCAYNAISESGPSDFLDVIALPQFRSSVAEAFFKYLKSHPSVCDEIEFENISDESVVKKELLPWMETMDVHYEIRRTDICPRLNTPSSVEQYLRGLHASVRRRLIQAQKTFSRDGIYALETMTSGTLSSAFQDLVALHQHRWNRLGYPGVFHDIRFQHFQQAVVQAFWNNGWVWFKSLRTDSVRIAARMGFRFNDRLYDYLSGFDEHPPFSKLRPGLALLLTMIEDAVESRCHSVELLRGKEQYKCELTSDFVCNWNIRFFNLNTTRTLRTGLYRIVSLSDYLMLQVSKQRLLFLVQYREHGLPGGMFRYVAFQSARLSDKVSSWLENYRQRRMPINQQSIPPERES